MHELGWFLIVDLLGCLLVALLLSALTAPAKHEPYERSPQRR